MEEMRHSYSILVGKHEGKRPVGRPRCRWEDNIGMDFREMGWECAVWIHLAQDREQWRVFVNVAMNFWVP
jgi:hypothetical protein